MKLFRWLEALSGLAAAALGGVSLVRLLTDPAAYTGEICQSSSTPPVCTKATATFLQVTGTTGLVDVCIIVCLLLGVTGAAIWHGWSGQSRPRTALWLFTVALAIYALLGQLSIGGLFFPSAALAILASLAALGTRHPQAA